MASRQALTYVSRGRKDEKKALTRQERWYKYTSSEQPEVHRIPEQADARHADLFVQHARFFQV